MKKAQEAFVIGLAVVTAVLCLLSGVPFGTPAADLVPVMHETGTTSSDPAAQNAESRAGDAFMPDAVQTPGEDVSAGGEAHTQASSAASGPALPDTPAGTQPYSSAEAAADAGPDARAAADPDGSPAPAGGQNAPDDASGISEPAGGTESDEGSLRSYVQTAGFFADPDASVFLSPTRIETGVPYQDELDSVRDQNCYMFRVFARGMLRYSLSAKDTDEEKGWKVSLYMEYSVNGSGGEKGYRLLNEMTALQSVAQTYSPNIGLGTGVYYLLVTPSDSFSGAAYQLTAFYEESTDYEIEYNDSVYRYTEIFADKPVRGSACARPDGVDRDYYMLRLPEDGAVYLTFEHRALKPVTVAFRIVLYDGDMNEIYSDNSELNRKSLSSGCIGLPKGNYFIGVFSRVYMDTDYKLTLSFEPGALYEKEDNDTPAAATEIQSDRNYTGALVSRTLQPDRDYYELTLPAAGMLRISFTNEAPVEPTDKDGPKAIRRLTVLAPDGTAICSLLMTTADGKLTAPQIGLPAGSVYLRVDNAGLYADSGAYTLLCTVETGGNWEQEPNGETERATPMAVGAGCTGTISDDETVFDVDWYSFSVSSTSALTLNLTHAYMSGRGAVFEAAVYDDKGTLIRTDRGELSLSIDRGETVAAADYTLPAGVYYVRVVSGVFHSEDAYTVSVVRR
ncbi:MAG: hypothetical protein IJK40_04425 [Clostridia bacterium]|nr:hypothetical protein [Clostridia bacterium]